MKISNRNLLKLFFTLKGNLSRGKEPDKKVFKGVEISPFKNHCKAAVCLSADFELNWAWRNLSKEERNLKGDRARSNFSSILRMLDDYCIPITWAIVGHLFLEQCKRNINGLPHSNMTRPQRNDQWTGDWYIHDPCTNFHKDPLWYAPDLIDQIIKSRVPHAIGTHTFSHVDLSPDYSNHELVRDEIEECIKAMEPFGLKPRSLVFPFNKMGYHYLDLFADLGIIAVRCRDKKIRLSYPERTAAGVYKIYESMNLRSPNYYDYLDKAKIFINEAVKRQAVYHLWFHPSDPTQLFDKEFRRIIEYISVERDKGVIWVATMEELAAYCNARESVKLDAKRTEHEIKISIESSFDRKQYGLIDITLIIPVEDLPKIAYLELENGVKEIKPNDLCLTNNGRELLLNVPIGAKLLRLRF